MSKDERMIIFFGVEDGGWMIHIFHEKDNRIPFTYGKNYDRQYSFILDVTKLPVQSIGLFDKISYLDLQTTRALFLLHLCKTYLEEYKYE